MKAMRFIHKIIFTFAVVGGLALSVSAQKEDKKPPPKVPPVVNPQPKPPPKENPPSDRPKKPDKPQFAFVIRKPESSEVA
jgi:hypothetical protein